MGLSLSVLIGLGCVVFAESGAAEVGSGSWSRVEVIEASKDVLGVPRLVQLDGAIRKAFDGHAEVDVLVVGYGQHRAVALDAWFR